MSTGSWTVHRGASLVEVTISTDGVRLNGGDLDLNLAWADLVTIEFPMGSAVRLVPTSGEAIQVGFASRTERQQFAGAYQAVLESVGADVTPAAPGLPPVRTPVLLVTTPDVSGRPTVATHGLVTAQCVMARNMFSDMGSDVKSVVGGRLGGIESAIANGIASVEGRLKDKARALGANAVVAVRVDIASVAGKAEAILITGTAVTLGRAPAAED